MLALCVRYLVPVVRIARADDPRRVEWPPHPDRLFSALVAAHYGAGPEPDPAERAALVTLERLGAPAIACSEAVEGSECTVFVPASGTRYRQVQGDRLITPDVPGVGVKGAPRGFPAVMPDDPVLYYIWPEAEPDAALRLALQSLARRVTRLGHSSSSVAADLVDQAPPPAWTPVPGLSGGTLMRVAGSGRLEQLDAAFEAGLRPPLAGWQAYRPSRTPEAPVTGSVWDPQLIPLQLVGRFRPAATRTLQLCDLARRAVLARCGIQPAPEWVDGHAADGTPTRRPHLAFMPLVSTPPEGVSRLLGIALAIPREITPEERAAALGPLLYGTDGEAGGLELYGAPGLPELTLQAVGMVPRAASLTPATWTRAGRVWASVTPVVMNGWLRNAERRRASIEQACEHVGLPRPERVQIMDVQLALPGVPAAVEFPQPVPNGDGGPRVRPLVHVILEFAQPVSGPIAIGAGRFKGYGTMKPIDRVEASR